jgi:F0F1-type ATP synthase assembly protein I
MNPGAPVSPPSTHPNFGQATWDVLRWQAGFTAVCAVIAALAYGQHAGISAALGGGIICVSFAVFGWVAWLGLQAAAQKNATGMWALLRAEIIKLALIVGLTVGVMRVYQSVVMPALFGSFLLVMLVGRFVMLKNAQKY